MTLTEKRRLKYPDTLTFHYHNANPKNKITTDCVIRALAAGQDIPYEQVVMELAELQIKTGLDSRDTPGIDKYLKSKGWIKAPQQRKEDGTLYTASEFCRKLAHPIYSEELNLPPCYITRMVANVGGHHCVAIVEQQVYDTWNSSDGKLHSLWVKPVA